MSLDDTDKRGVDQAALVAHQIKAPVSTLQTIIRTMLGGFSGELNAKQHELLASADSRCTEALATIRNLQALALAMGRGPGNLSSDLAAATAQAHERYRSEAADRMIEFTVRASVKEAPVNAKEAELQEAVAALVDNAVKYTPQGGKIVLELIPAKKQYSLRISDSGIGIPESEQKNLFTPFFRASNAKSLVASGTGLGLAFVKAVVETAGGHISVGRSDLGGALFEATFPHAHRSAAKTSVKPKKPSLRVVVVGGVAAGPKVAAKIMRLKPDAHVTIVEEGRVLSYAGCGFPYYISGQVKDQRELVNTPEGLERGPEYFEHVKNVRVLNRTRAIRLIRDHREVQVKDLLTGEESLLPYDKLAICTGSIPAVLRIPGAHLQNVFTLHGIEHAEGIKANLSHGLARDVVVVGGGLVGVIMTESLVVAGCRVTLVEKESQLLPMLDDDMAEMVHRYLEGKGIRVLLETQVTAFEGDGAVKRVVTEKGALPADMVIVGVGIKPNVELAADAGIELGPTGAIRVNDRMCTSDPDIYAAGDCVECKDLITGEVTYAPLGSTAAKQGRVAAVNICGKDDVFPGVLGTAICRVFEWNVARAGLTSQAAVEAGFHVVTTLTPGLDRAHYMPDAHRVVIKLVADSRTRKLLGIQAVGRGEAAKRVDVAISAMTAGMTVDQVSNLDLCYAPSYSEPLDNIHTACNVMKNKFDGQMTGISPADVRRKVDKGEDIVLLDVRLHSELEQARIEGAVHIPLGVLLGRMDELPRDKEIITFSRSSMEAYEASIILKANGFPDVKVMEGGILMWMYGRRK